MSDDRLTRDELARYSACAPERVELYCRLELISSADDGRFDKVDVSRVRLLEALNTSGITAEQLAAAERAGGMTVDFAGEVVAEQPGMTEQHFRAAIDGLGLDAAFTDRVFLALGLPAPKLDELVREDDRELLDIIAHVRGAGVPDAAILRILRIHAVNLSNIVAAQRDLFRQELEEPLLEQGISDRDMIARTAPLRLKLQRLAYRASFLIQRRLLEHSVFENLISHFERNLRTLGIATGARDATRTIAFLDISGFTQLTEEHGDSEAADSGSRLFEIVQNNGALHGARLVKLLGDGMMLHFRNATNAVHLARQVIAQAADAGLPPVRAGIATGPVIAQDGDYYGHTVNLAARLVAAAAAGTILVSQETRENVDDTSLVFETAGEAPLKGMTAPVQTFVLRAN